MLLSIIVPAYNVSRYIDECINSIRNSTYKNIEIICVNDGSTDDTEVCLKKHSSIDKRVHVITQGNQGVSAARQIGLNYAKGKFVTFVDGDDIIDIDAYSKALSYMDNADCVCFGVKLFGEGIKEADKEYYRIKYKGKENIRYNLLKNIDFSLCNKILKRDIIDKFNISFTPGLHYEDAEFFTKYAMVSNSIYFIDEYLYHYRRRPNSIMSDTFTGCPFAIDHLHIVKSIFDFMVKTNTLRKNKTSFIWMFRCYYSLARHYSFVNDHAKVDQHAIQYARTFIQNPILKDVPFVIDLSNGKINLHLDNCSFIEKIFSIKNSKDRKHKIIRLLGIKISIKRKI